jgi:quercetin dioxygenase-like cupin family protein
MEVRRLEDFKGGWVVGDFHPSLHRQKHVEVAVKHYKKGDVDKAHVHKIGTEITVVISGSAKMGSMLLLPGNVLVMEPGDPMPGDWEVQEDGTVTVCIKHPSVPGDKYPV